MLGLWSQSFLQEDHMRFSLFTAGSLCLGLAIGFVPGCAEDLPAGISGGTGGAGGTGGGGGGGTGGGTATVVAYADVKPIFVARCTPCHAAGGAGMGAHTLADSAATARAASYSGPCMGRTKGECSLIRVKAGTMPPMNMCTGNPAMDVGKAKCLTQDEQTRMQAWITGGLQ